MATTNVSEKLTRFLLVNPAWTQTRVSTSINVSVSALNAWMKGTYKGDNERIEKAVNYFLEARREAGEEAGRYKRDFDFVETQVYQDVLKSVNLAEYRGEIRPITGLSGIGKTMALTHIKSVRGEAFILVQVYQGMRKNRFLRKIAEAAGINAPGSFDDMFDILVDRLEGTGRMIAIDEAEHLTVEEIDAVRRIHDFTGCGVVLCGLPKFYTELQARQADYAYVYNRTSIPMKLGRNSANDLAAMASTMVKADVPAKVFETASNGIARDLRMILQESMRVAAENNIGQEDGQAFAGIIDSVSKKLGRKVSKSAGYERN